MSIKILKRKVTCITYEKTLILIKDQGNGKKITVQE